MFELFTELIAHRRISFEDGKIELFGKAVSMVPVDYIVTLQKNLEKTNNDTIIYYTAKETGHRWFKNLYNYFKIKPEDIARWGVNTISIAGWGKTEVVNIDLTNEVFYLKIKDAAQSKEYGKSDHCVDYFIRGSYASGATLLFGKECDAIETSCVSKGAAFCEFVCQPTERFDLSNPEVARQLRK